MSFNELNWKLAVPPPAAGLNKTGAGTDTALPKAANSKSSNVAETPVGPPKAVLAKDMSAT